MRRTGFLVLLGLTLTGCDLSQLGFSTTATEPKANVMYVMGAVVDRFNQPLVGATVFNGADQFKTSSSETLMSLGDENGGSLLVPPGYFVLKKNISTNNTGRDTVRAVFDGISSTAVSMDLTKKTTAFKVNKNYSLLLEDGSVDSEKLTGLSSVFNLALLNATVSVPVDGPIPNSGDFLSCVKYLGGDSNGTFVAEPSITGQASGSTTVYTPANGIVNLILQAPPGSQGTTIRAYQISYLTADQQSLTTTQSRTLPNPVTVMPANNTDSGNKATVPIDMRGDWPTAMKTQGVSATAVVTFYTNTPYIAGNKVKRFEKTLNSSRQIITQTQDLTATILLKAQ